MKYWALLLTVVPALFAKGKRDILKFKIKILHSPTVPINKERKQNSDLNNEVILTRIIFFNQYEFGYSNSSVPKTTRVNLLI